MFPALPACWYLGAKGQGLWAQLSEQIVKFAQSVGAKHRIYVGGSSGGFAALLYAALDPGSTVVAYNSQTNLLEHIYPDATRNYFNAAWDGTEGEAPLDLREVYKNTELGAIVYLQSPADFGHLHKQALPFLAALPQSYLEKLVVDFKFSGVHGHSGSIKRDAVQEWVGACVRARSADIYGSAQILDAKYAIEQEIISANPRGAEVSRKVTPRAATAAQLNMAERVRTELMKVSKT